MLLRLVIGTGVFAFGYFLGYEVGRTEPLREELRRARQRGFRVTDYESDIIDATVIDPIPAHNEGHTRH